MPSRKNSEPKPEGTSRVVRRAAEAVAERRRIDDAVDEALSPAERAALENLRRVQALQDLFGAAGETAQADPELAREWGHLEIRGQLGAGSYGEVYRAYDSILQREVALKLRPPGSAASAAEFLREARRLARVRHPNVLAVHGADVHNLRAGLWADLIEGETLASRIERGPTLTMREKFAIVRALIRALVAVHEAGLVHGDVKASNVMIDAAGAVTLMDFGSGSLAGEASGPLRASPLSMAPELFAGDHLSPASDMYALGVVAYLLYAGGRYPLQASSYEELEQQHSAAQPSREPLLCSPVMRRFVLSLLAKDPAKRPTARAAAESLRRIEHAPAVRRRNLAIAAVLTSSLAGTMIATFGYLNAKRSERVAVEASEESEALNSFVLGLFELGDPNHAKGEIVGLDEMLDEGARRVEAELREQPRRQAELEMVLGGLERKLGRADRAQVLYERALIKEHLLDPRQLARALNGLGEVTFDQGRYSDAYELHTRAVDLLSADDLDTPKELARSLNFLSRTVRAQGDYEQAEALSRRALDHLAGLQDPLLLADIQVDLGVALYLQERYQAARLLYEEALATRRQLLGELHVDVAALYNRVGLLENRLAHLDESAAAFETSIALYEQLLGPSHPETLMIRGNLGGVRARQGDRVKALEIRREIANAMEEVLGADHPDYAIALSTLASLVQTEDASEALALFRQAREIMRRTHGNSHPYIASTDYAIARTLRSLGRAREALVPAQNALSLAEALSLGSSLRLRYQAELAMVLRTNGELQRAGNEYQLLLDASRDDESRSPFWETVGHLGLARVAMLGGDCGRAAEHGEETEKMLSLPEIEPLRGAIASLLADTAECGR